MNDYKKSMSVSNRKINLIGKDGKLKILDLTQKLAEKILSTFKKSDKSTVKAVEEELGKQENVQTQAQEERAERLFFCG